MKVSLLSENLQKKISFLNRAVSARSQLPVLSNFLIKTEKGKIVFSATDLEIGIVTSVSGSVDEEGGVTVPAKTFSELINSIGEGKITLETKGNNLELRGQKTKTTFQTIAEDEFPKILETKGEEIIKAKKEDLEKEFSRIVYAASQDSGRPALSGVLIDKDKQGVLIVSTDGFRLSLRRNMSLGPKKGLEKGILMSSRVVREFLGIKEEVKDVVISISEKNNQVIFEIGETVLVGRLIDAEYPNFEKIIPVDFGTSTQMDKNEMLNAVKIASVFARESANIIKLSIEKDKIIVSANSPSVGENQVEVEAKTQGEENEIAFNGRYLLDFLSNTESENLIFQMAGPLNPGVFKIPGDKDYLHLIMPIRIQEQ